MALASLLPPDTVVWAFIIVTWTLFAVAAMVRVLWPRKQSEQCVHGTPLSERCKRCRDAMAGKHIDLDNEPPSARETLDDPDFEQAAAAVTVTQDPISGVVEVADPDFPETPTPPDRPQGLRVPPPPPTGPRGAA